MGMEELIKLYLLECPRSVSDMLRDLTEKKLSGVAALRSEQIPRMAGNWFKKDTGYLWRLQEQGVINDVGRQYALDKDWLVEGFIDVLGVRDRFPEHDVRGGSAAVEAAYSYIMPEYRLNGLKREMREQLFSGSLMKELFAFDRWQDAALIPETDGRRVQLYRPVLGFWTVVHIGFVSSLLVSRWARLTQLMDAEDGYFRWKQRRERLEETQEALVKRVVHACFPDAVRGVGGEFGDERAQKLADAVREVGVELPEQTLELIGDLYLLSFNDGVGLFQQQTRQDDEIHVLFNLLERGWLVASRNLDQDPVTGNYIVPLGEVHSYLDNLAHRCRPHTRK